MMRNNPIKVDIMFSWSVTSFSFTEWTQGTITGAGCLAKSIANNLPVLLTFLKMKYMINRSSLSRPDVSISTVQ